MVNNGWTNCFDLYGLTHVLSAVCLAVIRLMHPMLYASGRPHQTFQRHLLEKDLLDHHGRPMCVSKGGQWWDLMHGRALEWLLES